MYRDLLRGLDAQSHPFAPDINDRDDDIVTDNDAFGCFAAQHQHREYLLAFVVTGDCWITVAGRQGAFDRQHDKEREAVVEMDLGAAPSLSLASKTLFKKRLQNELIRRFERIPVLAQFRL